MQNPFKNEAYPRGQGEWFNQPGAPMPQHPMNSREMQSFPGPTEGAGGESELDIENEPPLLEELGIDIDAVIQRIKAVALLRPLPQQLVLEGDLTGPLIILLSFVGALLLQGKLYVESVYVLSVISWLSSYTLINLMAQKGGIDLYCAASMFGYGLLPVVGLAFISILVSLKSSGILGFILGMLTIGWCTATSSKFVGSAIDSKDQQWLIAYPTGLMYAAFVVITIF